MLQDDDAHTAEPAKTMAHQSSKVWPVKDRSKTSPAAPVSARYLGDTIAFKNKRHNTVPHHGGLLARPSSANEEGTASLVSTLQKEGYDMASEETTQHLLKVLDGVKRESKKGRDVS
jgi:hypothetical protein